MHNRSGRALALGAALSLAASPLMAETAPSPAAAPPAAPAAVPSFAGPNIPGLCIISMQSLYEGSKVGTAASARLTQMQSQIEAELQAKKSAIEASARNLQAKGATMAPVQAAQEQRSLNQRAQALQAAASERSEQLEATRAKVLNRIKMDAMPVIQTAYQGRGCGVLFDRSTVVAGAVGMDLTDQVIQALDAKETSIAFDLEPAPAAGR